MGNVPLKYIQTFTDRHGRRRCYYRRRGYPRTPLPLPEDPDFARAYADASEREAPGRQVKPRSLAALILSYYQSAAFTTLMPSTQQTYRLILERLRAEKGHTPVAGWRPKHVELLMDERAATPGAARQLRKRLAQVFDRGVKLEWMASNPARAVKSPGSPGAGFYAWTEDDIARFEAAYPAGSRERLALHLLLYTGQRRSDVVRMGPGDIEGKKLRVRQAKNRVRREVNLLLPIHPTLKATLARTGEPGENPPQPGENPEALRSFSGADPEKIRTFLRTGRGEAFTAAGFSNWFRDQAIAAGLPKGASPHGLRKAAARRLAEAGCTAKEIAAITGHSTLGEVARYTASADQARLAEAAMGRVRRAEPSNRSVKPSANSRKD